MNARLGACIVLVVLVVAATAARADDYADFRIPANTSVLWDADLSLGGAHGAQNATGYAAKFGSLGGDAASRYSWQRDTDPAYTRLSLQLRAGGNRARQKVHSESLVPGFLSNSQDRRDRSTFEVWGVDAATRRYPLSLPFYLSAAVNAGENSGQSWQREQSEAIRVDAGGTARNVSELRDEQWSYDSQIVASAGAGFGRVRNATGVYEARVLEERLLAAGALTRALSAAARTRLAALMYLDAGYGQVHDRPSKELWREVERIARDDGALGAGIAPDAVERGTEPFFGAGRSSDFPRSNVQRLRGAYAGLVVMTSHYRFSRRFDRSQYLEATQNGVIVFSDQSEFHDHSLGSFDVTSAGAEAEFHRPLGPRWQVDATARATTGLRADETALQFFARTGATWMVADRWIAQAAVTHRRYDPVRHGASTPYASWAWELGGSLGYFLEDHLLLSLKASETQAWQRVTGFDPFVRDGRVSLGLNYRFMGRFDAAGFDHL